MPVTAGNAVVVRPVLFALIAWVDVSLAWCTLWTLAAPRRAPHPTTGHVTVLSVSTGRHGAASGGAGQRATA